MMNSLSPALHRRLPQLLISLVFLALLGSIVWSLSQYWNKVLQPRLLQAAETHAQMLADAQANTLAETLRYPNPANARRALQQAVREMLLVTDPAISGPFVRGLSLQVDYDVVKAPKGSLDIKAGDVHCQDCFPEQVAVMGRNDELLAIAQFRISNAYYRQLNADLKNKLLAESSLALVLLVVVWITMLILYGRLQRANEMMRASDRAKTRFMANMSHELRTPLNAILGYTQLYKRDATLMENFSRGINTIDRSAEHLLQMINDVLDFSKMDSDQIQLQPREVALEELLTVLVEMTLVRARLKDIEFVHDFPAGLPNLVQVDDKRLRQVLLNLLSNAVKFTQRGRVNFRVYPLPGKKSDGGANIRLRFEVEDTGVGIPANRQQEIFLPFHQLDSAMSGAEGSGLGLTISASLVTLMGGSLEVASTPGKGSRFWFDLNLPVVLTPHTAPGTRRVTGYRGPRRHILFIDDNAYNRDVIHQQLQQLGFDVSEADNGPKGLELLQQKTVDLVLLDILMPGMDGFETVNRIRALKGPDLPVLALTADTQPQTVEKARTCGFDAVLTKPVPEAELLTELSQRLQLEWDYEMPQETEAKTTPPLNLPATDIIANLIDCARRHDVLGLRKIISELEQDSQYRGFIDIIAPLISAYQFRKLIDDLQALAPTLE